MGDEVHTSNHWPTTDFVNQQVRKQNWYADAAFVVHKDMRINTGSFMTMGTGGAYVHSRKNDMNTKSSTDAKLVKLDDVLTQVICTQYFLKE